MPDDLRQCDACGQSVEGNLTPKPHHCRHGQPCKPLHTSQACAECRTERGKKILEQAARAAPWLNVARRLGIELIKNG